jgi:hypothetical protein
MTVAVARNAPYYGFRLGRAVRVNLCMPVVAIDRVVRVVPEKSGGIGSGKPI